MILSRETAENGQMLREILSYLENNPVFARNILIYVGDEETLETAKKKEEDTGIYLEDLAKNQPGDGALELPLKDLLNYLHNGEASIKLRALYTENGEDSAGRQYRTYTGKRHLHQMCRFPGKQDLRNRGNLWEKPKQS